MKKLTLTNLQHLTRFLLDMKYETYGIGIVRNSYIMKGHKDIFDDLFNIYGAHPVDLYPKDWIYSESDFKGQKSQIEEMLPIDESFTIEDRNKKIEEERLKIGTSIKGIELLPNELGAICNFRLVENDLLNLVKVYGKDGEFILEFSV